MLSNPSWPAAPRTPALENDAVHVWCASLDLGPLRVRSLQQTLDRDERERAQRYYFEKDRTHFIVARGLLRTILGRYLNMEPSQFRFRYNSYGKPALGKMDGGCLLQFNLSHSHGVALYAITQVREIGVDLEYISEEFPYKQIAEQFFTPREIAVLRLLPRPQQRDAFFNCWTRKEAYVKARGQGHSLPLDEFDVSFLPGEPVRLLNTKGNQGETNRWTLQELFPKLGFVAAICVEGEQWKLHCWRL